MFLPSTFPSRLLETLSQSLTETSAATFLEMRWSFIFSRTGSMSARVSVLLPTRELRDDQNPPAEEHLREYKCK
jgi:hypothetical protein